MFGGECSWACRVEGYVEQWQLATVSDMKGGLKCSSLVKRDVTLEVPFFPNYHPVLAAPCPTGMSFNMGCRSSPFLWNGT